MPLPSTFWGGPPADAPKTTFRGTVKLGFVQNNEDDHDDLFKRSASRQKLKRWFDDGCAMYVILQYITDEYGRPKSGERPTRSISHLWWHEEREDVLVLVRRGTEHWLIVAGDEAEEGLEED